MKHDAYRQIGYIQQALSQNRKPVGVFLGAGCPFGVEIEYPFSDIRTKKQYQYPLIPDVLGLTKIITDKLKSNNDIPSPYDKLIKQMEEDQINNPNIEDLLSQLRALKQVAGKGMVREFVASELNTLDDDICNIISEEVNKELPFRDSPYHSLAIWARSIPRQKPVHIFTTNYDLLIEQALEETACPYFDGFIGSKNAFFDLGTVEDEELLHPRWCRLWKIHGSINWKIDKEQNVVRSDKIEKDENYLIYPSHLKYDQSRKMPYLAMLDRIKEFILYPSSILFTSGYSFSDDHINNVMVQALQSNPTAMCFAFVYGNLNDEKYVKAKQCAMQVPNLSLIAFDKGIVGRLEGDWHLSDEEKIGEIPAEVIAKIVEEEGEEENKQEIIRYEFRLGDFGKFGQFLREMSIYEHKENED
ncbi:MAG: SIR2 family protein [Bacteroidales bacterium]